MENLTEETLINMGVHDFGLRVALLQLIARRMSLKEFLGTIPKALVSTPIAGSQTQPSGPRINAVIPDSVVLWSAFKSSVLDHHFDIPPNTRFSRPILPPPVVANYEIGVHSHFMGQVTNQFEKFLEEANKDMRFREYQSVTGRMGDPDIVLVSAAKGLYFFIEMKTKRSLDNLIGQSSLHETWDSDASLRQIMYQVMGYLCHNELKYCALSSFESTWFFERQDMTLLVSPVIRFSDNSPTLYHSLLYVIELCQIQHHEPYDRSQGKLKSVQVSHKSLKGNLDSTSSAGVPITRSQTAANANTKRKMADRFRSRGEEETTTRATMALCGIPSDFHLGLLGDMVGEGYCGIVYRSHYNGHDLAIKMSDVYNNKEGVRLMKEEVKIYETLQSLQGTTIPRLWFYGESWGFYMIATSYVDGVHPSASHLGKQHIDQLVNDRLQELNDCGVIHGDVRDNNILVTPGGNVVLLDFSHSKVLDSRHE
jgi:hypothetical protein